MRIRPLEWSVYLTHLFERNYDATSVGESMGIDVDHYQMWHSSMADAETSANYSNFRNAEADALIEQITAEHTSFHISGLLSEAAIPHSPITPIEGVADLPIFKTSSLNTVTPNGKPVRLPPPAVPTEHLEKTQKNLAFAPAYGEHTDTILKEAGLSADEIADLRGQGVVA